MNIDKIKLVIWDLDDTFWSGILSEGPVKPINDNIKLVKELTNRGIVNSICSKNNNDEAIAKLEEFGVSDLFVFKSIDWTPKGQRIASLIKNMGLRPVNCLFIDDNIVNLNEAAYYSKDLMIAEPSIIKDLLQYCKDTEATDNSHKRLLQYYILEEKHRAKEEAGDNMAFLYSSNTRVEVFHNCQACADRLFELVHRTNQLNFTKNRCSREEFDKLLTDNSVNCGYVTVKDNFGDYGIVGFFAIKENKCIHFLFSCRTIGQGVEQWVYSKLGCPELKIVGDVVNKVEQIAPPAWINQKITDNEESNERGHEKIVFKGACDLSIMSSYINSDNIIEEFTYIGEKGNSIEHHNHSINLLSFNFLDDTHRAVLLNDCVFNDPNMFQTAVFDKDVSLVFLSTQIEAMLGIYQNKQNGLKIAFGDYIYPLTDKNNWGNYITGSIQCHENVFTKEWLTSFSEKYDFLGRMTPQEYLSQLDDLFCKISPKTHVCLLLGSEMPFYAEQLEGYKDRHLYYKEMNDLIREYVKTQKRLHLIDFNKYLKKQSDFTNNINHFQRHIYYQAAVDANKLIVELTGAKNSHTKGYLYYLFTFLRNKIANRIKRESFLFKFLEKFNQILKNK